MMLLAAFSIWLTLVLFLVALCRMAASADGRDVALTERYPSSSAVGARTDAAGLLVLKEQPAQEAPQKRTLLTAHGVRRRAKRCAARS